VRATEHLFGLRSVEQPHVDDVARADRLQNVDLFDLPSIYRKVWQGWRGKQQ
jgi:hypothetical protein